MSAPAYAVRESKGMGQAMKHVWIGRLAAIAAVTAALPASATTYVRNGTIDLSGYTPDVSIDGLYVAAKDIDFSEVPALFGGDVVRGTMTFANGAVMTMMSEKAEEFFYFAITNERKGIDRAVSTLRFTGVTGSLLGGNDFVEINGGGAVGPYIVRNLTDSSFSFTGFEYSIELAGSPNNNQGRFNAAGAGARRGSYTIPATPAVPEPATWAMMILGFGVAGAVLRRRRAPARVTSAA